jgi:thiamine transport system ATP-binding protein
VLEVRGVVVRYGAKVALDGVDLTVGDGEVVSVLGPSGSGKTSLLRAIAGLEPLHAGAVVRDGVDLAGVPPHRRELGLMFQDHALFPHRDVLGNVAFGLRMHDVARRDAEARARVTLALVGLSGMEHRSVRELSGGEQQRVALARALAPEPRLLMLDEPLGSLDRALRERLAEELRELFDRLDLSVVLVTHDHDEAFAIGDRVAVMAAGHIEQIGAPAEVWRAPATERVARFLGCNVVPGPLVGDSHAQVALRPEALEVDDRGLLAGTVIARTFRRDHFLVRVRIASDGEAGPSTLEVAVSGDPPAVGSSVRLSVEEGAVVPLAG